MWSLRELSVGAGMQESGFFWGGYGSFGERGKLRFGET
jgi:hypothetical protein